MTDDTRRHLVAPDGGALRTTDAGALKTSGHNGANAAPGD